MTPIPGPAVRCRLISMFQVPGKTASRLHLSRNDEGDLRTELVATEPRLATRIEDLGIEVAFPAITGIPIVYGANETFVEWK